MSVPSAPHNMTSTPGNGQVALTWATPASNGGSAITGYEYRYQPASGVFTSWTVVPDSNVNTAAYTVTGLTNGMGHEFQVRAITATNKGAAASLTTTPIANPPTPPQTLSALHFNQSVNLSWLAPVSNGGSPIIRYEYRQRTGEAAFGEWTAIPDSGTGQVNELTYSVPKLTNGTNYTFEVHSVNSADSSAPSNQASATPQVITTPGQPRDYAVSSGDGEIFLQWLKPAQDGGRPISNYEYCLDLVNQCSANWTTIPDNAISLGERGFLAVASSNGSYTRAKLRAVNSQDGGAEDDLAAVPIAGAPAAPDDLKAETISSTQVRVTWTEPQSQEGTTITSYTLEQSADGLKWNDGSQPKSSTSIIKDIGKDAIAYFRIRTRFKTDSPLIISGADFSWANSPWTEIVTATTVGAEQNTAVTVSVADSYAHEGTSSDVVFDVYLSSRPETASTISVDYRTHDHTATAGQDYTAQSGTLAFSPGERAKTISVPIIDDNHEDSGESFTLVLSNPTGTIIARAGATGSIYNEESLITGFTLTNLSTNADVQAIAAGDTITLDNPADGSYSFRANPTNEAVIGSVKLELAGTHTASRTDNDQPYTLHDHTGAGLPSGNYTIKATVYTDHDAGGTPHQTISTSFSIAATAEAQASQLSVADATASEENDSSIDFVVTINPTSDESVTVDYATAGGTATAGEDYTAKSGTLTFNAGDTTKTIQVPITDDTIDDDNETITLTISNASGADISDATATGTITNNEPVPLTASFTNAPATHSGSGIFTFDLLFSENIKARLQAHSRQGFHRHRRRRRQGQAQGQGQQPELDHHGRARRKRSRQHHAAGDHRLRRRRRHLHLRQTHAVQFNIGNDLRAAVTIGNRRTHKGGQRDDCWPPRPLRACEQSTSSPWTGQPRKPAPSIMTVGATPRPCTRRNRETQTWLDNRRVHHASHPHGRLLTPEQSHAHGVPDRHPRDRGRLTSRPDQQPSSGTWSTRRPRGVGRGSRAGARRTGKRTAHAGAAGGEP